MQTVYSESGIKISQTQPFAFNLGREGQYVITVEIDDTEGFIRDLFEVFVTIGEETRYLLYNYNNESNKDCYMGVVDVTEKDYIIVGTSSEQTLITTITLESLYLGEKNDFILTEVNISPTPLYIDFLAAENIYMITADVLNVTQEISETGININIGEQNVTLTRIYEGVNIFSCIVEVKGEEQNIMSISASNDYTVNITAQKAPDYELLPESAELTALNSVTYSYIQKEATGYYCISAVCDNASFSVSVVFKTDPMEMGGLYTRRQTPLYMEQGNIYYFEVMNLRKFILKNIINMSITI